MWLALSLVILLVIAHKTRPRSRPPVIAIARSRRRRAREVLLHTAAFTTGCLVSGTLLTVGYAVLVYKADRFEDGFLAFFSALLGMPTFSLGFFLESQKLGWREGLAPWRTAAAGLFYPPLVLWEFRTHGGLPSTFFVPSALIELLLMPGVLAIAATRLENPLRVRQRHELHPSSKEA